MRRVSSGVRSPLGGGQGQPSQMLSKLLDPSESPFAVGMTSDEDEELRSQLPGSQTRTKRSSVGGSDGNHGVEETRLSEEANLIRRARNKNRDARVAALSMLNE